MKTLSFFLPTVFFVIFSLISNIQAARYDPDLDHENPFANDTNILSLTEESLTQNILHQPNIHLVFLYSQLCPNCIPYILEMQVFARQISAWQPVCKVAALNCITFPMACMNLKVTSFPSYIFVPANAKEIPKNSTEQLLSFSQILPEMIDFIRTQTDLMNSNSLSPTLVNMKQEICNLFQFQNKIVSPFAILEPVFVTQNDGFQLLLDLFEYRESIQIRRFYTSNSELFESLSVLRQNLPAFYSVDIDHGNCSFTLISKYESSNINSFRETAIKHITTKFPLDMKSASTSIPQGKNHTSNEAPPISGLTYTDLYNTLHLCLVKEMYRFESFNTDDIDILKEFYTVVHIHFPFRNENVRRFFKRMRIWWSKRPEKKDVRMIAYKEVTRISDGFLMPLAGWKHCRGSKPYFRGYSCGLWSLFHVLTVQEYLDFKNPRSQKIIHSNPMSEPKIRETDNHTQTPPEMHHSSLKSMIKFIPRFFSCQECAINFAKSTKNFESQLTSPELSILYLWRLHNQINARLTNDQSVDPFFPKHQFPSRELCPQCSDNNGLFNETEVFQFLIKHYSEPTLRANSDT